MPPRKDDDMDASSSSEEDAFSGFDSEEEAPARPKTGLYEKDSDEEELERLVLGNRDGFRENLFGGDWLAAKDDDNNALELVEPDDSDMEEVDDADLFMLDTGAAGPGQAGKGSKKSAPAIDKNAPAWEDSDDERLTVSLAGVSRLRKLRTTAADDVVNGTEYCRRLREHFVMLQPSPAWARYAEDRPAKRRRRSSAASSDDNDSSGVASDDEMSAQPLEAFLRDVRRLAGTDGAGKKRRLRPEVLDIQRTREIPDKHKAPVESLSFHPEYPVLLSASTASILYLHHIAPEAQPTPNPQLTSVQVKQVDTRRAEFLYPHGDKIVFAGRRKFFHQWDLKSGVVQKTNQVTGHRLEHKTMERFRLSPCGRYMGIVSSKKKGGGIINVLSTGSMQWIAAARLSSQNGVADFAWWSNGEGMTILGKDGQVGEYSMATRTFTGVWHDEGCVGGIILRLGGHQGPQILGEDRWVAVGSRSGITNIYDRNELVVGAAAGADAAVTVKERPAPARTFEQIVTPITAMAFSPDGQLFAFGSRDKKDALKLVHLPSCTVYRNWPTQETPLGRITAVAFGRESDVLAVGNDAGKIRLWQIRA